MKPRWVLDAMKHGWRDKKPKAWGERYPPGAGSKSYDAFVILPDPLLSKTTSAPADTTAVAPGTPVTFTLTATNPAGSSTPKHTALYEATLTDVIPADVIVDAGSVSTPAGVTCDTSGLSPSGGGTLSCDLGTLGLRRDGDHHLLGGGEGRCTGLAYLRQHGNAAWAHAARFRAGRPTDLRGRVCAHRHVGHPHGQRHPDQVGVARVRHGRTAGRLDGPVGYGERDLPGPSGHRHAAHPGWPAGAHDGDPGGR